MAVVSGKPDDRVPMPASSRYRGQLADARSRRSIRLRQAITPETATATCDYFYHAGQFWTALVPLDGVVEIRGQAFNFSAMRTRKTPTGPEPIRDDLGAPKRVIPILNHVQSRFLLNEPVRLFPLHDRPQGTPAHEIHDWVYSLEAVGPEGINFNLRDSLNGSLVSAHRFVSTEEMVFERIVVENQYLKETPGLKLTAEERRGALIASLLRSDRAGWQEPYYLYRFCGTNNCTSNPFQILDGVVNYSGWQRLAVWLFRLPLKPRLYLRVRGLDPAPGTTQLLRNEFQSFIQDPVIQQRKRDEVRAKIRRKRAQREMDDG
ncbi:MAG: hypothetical protein AAGF97_13695 [Planctomycetota bacterium]